MSILSALRTVTVTKQRRVSSEGFAGCSLPSPPQLLFGLDLCQTDPSSCCSYQAHLLGPVGVTFSVAA